jgi:hypothetical protein
MRHIYGMAIETNYPVRKLIYLTAEQAEQISEFRHGQRISSENEAIRQLLAFGLEKAGELKAEPKGVTNG